MDNLNTEIPWTGLYGRGLYGQLNTEIPTYMDNLNTEIPYMITRFIWTTLIQKYHTW